MYGQFKPALIQNKDKIRHYFTVSICDMLTTDGLTEYTQMVTRISHLNRNSG